MKTFYALGFLLFFLSCNSTPKDDPMNLRLESPLSGDEVIDEFMSLVNDYRQQKGLRGLLLDSSINEIALEHSENMAQAEVSFGHAGFSLRCSQARQALGGGNLCLENVARGQRTAQEVFNAWINSTGHRENIESARATHMGLGYSRDNKNVYYWTQLFLER